MENSIIPGAELRNRQLPVSVNWSSHQVGQARIAALMAVPDYGPGQTKELLALNNAIGTLTDSWGGKVDFSGRQSEELIYALMGRAMAMRRQGFGDEAALLVSMAAELQAAR